MPVAAKSPSSVKARLEERDFSETEVWGPMGDGWRQLHGSYRDVGFSFEWHDFTLSRDMEWNPSFHPGSLEICLNLAGNGMVSDRAQRTEFGPLSTIFYWQNRQRLRATRLAGGRHQFLTVELSPAFLRKYFSGNEANLHPIVKAIVTEADSIAISEITRLSAEHQQLMAGLRHPPVFASAQPIWYQAKTLEVVSAFLFKSPPENEFFCQRQKRVGQDRVDRVISILKSDIAEPPTLEALGKQVGCSPFYLSRIFSQQMGQTISQFLRQLRMEKAAELLRQGRLNVTQVAMEVGYSSSSHFSVAFHETFGCCPGLYPLPTFTGRRKVSRADPSSKATER